MICGTTGSVAQLVFFLVLFFVFCQGGKYKWLVEGPKKTSSFCRPLDGVWVWFWLFRQWAKISCCSVALLVCFFLFSFCHGGKCKWLGEGHKKLHIFRPLFWLHEAHSHFQQVGVTSQSRTFPSWEHDPCEAREPFQIFVWIAPLWETGASVKKAPWNHSLTGT